MKKDFNEITIVVITVIAITGVWLYLSPKSSNDLISNSSILNEEVTSTPLTEQEKADQADCISYTKKQLAKVKDYSFDQYPVKDVYTGKIAQLDMSNKLAQDFGTTIKENLKNGVNFAGHYIISELTLQGAYEVLITDAYDGKTYELPYLSYYGNKFTSTSSLFVINDKENIIKTIEEGCFGVDEDQFFITHYFVWENNTFKPLNGALEY